MAMTPLGLHEFHSELGAAFGEVNGCQVTLRFQDPAREFKSLRECAAWMDLSHRGRLCLVGADRTTYLHGQVTQDIKGLQPGWGAYAFLLSAKGRIQSDLKVHCLKEELLLDFEPGLSEAITRRLETYIIADDVQVVNVRDHYGLLAVGGPKSGAVLARTGWMEVWPEEPWTFAAALHAELGELYCMNQPFGTLPGFQLYLPAASLQEAARQLHQAVTDCGGAPAGWEALEIERVEAGRPRFGIDIDESNLPQETGQEGRAVSFQKGCYIGQEIVARIRTYGQVTKHLVGLRLDESLPSLPPRGTKLRTRGAEAREVGYLTSRLRSPNFAHPLALGYVRREHNQPGNRLFFLDEDGCEQEAWIQALPFQQPT